MENPATWTKIHKLIDSAIREVEDTASTTLMAEKIKSLLRDAGYFDHIHSTCDFDDIPYHIEDAIKNYQQWQEAGECGYSLPATVYHHLVTQNILSPEV